MTTSPSEMLVRAEAFMGLDDVRIPLRRGSVTWVTGPNMAGKSSAALAAGAVFAQTTNPLHVPATAVSRYVRQGHEEGLVTLDCDGDQVVRWTVGSGLGVKHEFPATTEVSAAITDMTVTLKKSARIQLWEGLFAPPIESVAKALDEELRKLLPKDTAKDVLDEALAHGFRSATRTYADRATDAKRLWRSVTGETWGSAKAKGWLPREWQAELDGMTPDDAETVVRDAQRALASSQATNAVSEAALRSAEDDLKTMQGRKAAVEQDVVNAKSVEQDAEAALKARQTKLDAALEHARDLKRTLQDVQKRRPSRPVTHVCPHCEGNVMMVAGSLVVAADSGVLDSEIETWSRELAEAKDAFDTAVAQGKPLRESHAIAERELMTAVRATADAASARDRLLNDIATAERTLAVGEDGPTLRDRERQITAAETAVRTATEHKTLVEQLAAARKHHANVVHYQGVASAIEAAAVMHTEKVEQGRTRLNAYLKRMSDGMRWPVVEVSDDFVVMVGAGTPIRMLSESERWRASLMLRGAICLMKADPVLVIDRADILDDKGRRVLIAFCKTMCKAKKPPALMVCATPTFPPPNNEHFDLQIVKLG